MILNLKRKHVIIFFCGKSINGIKSYCGNFAFCKAECEDLSKKLLNRENILKQVYFLEIDKKN